MASRLAVISFLDESGSGVYPGHDLPSGPVYPSHGLPGGPLRPDNGLPVGPPGSIGTLPVFPFDPSLKPDNSLPGQPPVIAPPIQIHPGLKLVVRWVACLGFIAVPDHDLPETAEPRR